MWDDDNKVWHLAIADHDEVLGMVAIRDGREICSFYVTPSSRGKSVGYALLHNATKALDGCPLKATATDASLDLFLLCGFREIGTRGRFHLLERVAADVQP